MREVHCGSTEMDTEFDIIDEISNTLNDIENGYQKLNPRDVRNQIGYIRFLVEELGDSLKGEYESLRQRRYIVKRSR